MGLPLEKGWKIWSNENQPLNFRQLFGQHDITSDYLVPNSKTVLVLTSTVFIYNSPLSPWSLPWHNPREFLFSSWFSCSGCSGKTGRDVYSEIKALFGVNCTWVLSLPCSLSRCWKQRIYIQNQSTILELVSVKGKNPFELGLQQFLTLC